jgi:hypothetical protein
MTRTRMVWVRDRGEDAQDFELVPPMPLSSTPDNLYPVPLAHRPNYHCHYIPHNKANVRSSEGVRGKKERIATGYGNIQLVLHFSQAIPCTNRLKSSMVEAPYRDMVIVFLGKHKLTLFHGGTQNSFSAFGLTTQPDGRS